ncbi:MAG: LD-carboxypeptidase [Candidatus Omnitrophota bacterium]|jgi:muramoyltetrapeptide carboxypeptidase|nr:MAG: LD-carboxypeptidase [Candidatus Omnitrophota bacterium]
MTQRFHIQPLQPGDWAALAAPAKSISPAPVEPYADLLRTKGYRVKIGENVSKKVLLDLAGTDADRIDALNMFFRDPEIRAIFCLTGGYGVTRILRHLDYAALSAHPKIICGYSDITALHVAVSVKTGLITFHSPNMDSVSRTAYTDRCWWAMLEGQLHREPMPPLPPDDDYNGPETWTDGVAEGVLLGGNLSLLAALAGTPFALPIDRDVILFLEDVGELSSRVDFMLHQLRLAGAFERVRGMMLGQFTYRKNQRRETPELLSRVLQTFCQELNIPVLANLPFGHVRNNLTLAHGARVRLDAGRKQFSYLA